MPLTIHNMNSKTGGPLGPDAQREAVSRCIAVLFASAHTADILGRLHTGLDPAKAGYVESATELNLTLLTHGQSLHSDIQALAQMVGLELIAIPAQKGAQA